MMLAWLHQWGNCLLPDVCGTAPLLPLPPLFQEGLVFCPAGAAPDFLILVDAALVPALPLQLLPLLPGQPILLLVETLPPTGCIHFPGHYVLREEPLIRLRKKGVWAISADIGEKDGGIIPAGRTGIVVAFQRGLP